MENSKYFIRYLPLRSTISIAILFLLFSSRIFGDQRFIDFFYVPQILLLVLFILSIIIFVFKSNISINFISYYFLFFIIIYLIFSFINRSIFFNFSGVIFEITRYFLFLFIGLLAYNFILFRIFFNAYIYIYILSLFVAFLQIISILPLYNERIDSFFGHPNGYANYLAISIAFFLYCRLINYKISSVFIILGYFFIFLTGSRTAIILCLFSSYFIYNQIFLKNRSKIIKLCQKFIILILVIVSLYIFRERFFSEFYSLISSNASIVNIVENRELSGSFTWRIYNWYMLIDYWIDHNLWFGNGIAYTEILNIKITGNQLQAHNDYIKYIFETGLIGFLLILLLHLVILNKIYFMQKLHIEIYPFYIFFIFFCITKFFDGLEQSNILMIILSMWGCFTFKNLKYRINENCTRNCF